MRRKVLDEAAMREQRARGALLREVAESHGCSVTTAFHRTKGVTRMVVLEGGDVVAGHGVSEITASDAITDARKV